MGKFKVGDKVTVAKVDGDEDNKDYLDTLGKTGVITKLDNDDLPYKVVFKEPYDFFWYSADELKLAKKIIDPKDVLRLLLEGKRIRHSRMDSERYMKFINGNIKDNDGAYCDVTWWVEQDGEFTEYIAPPKFKPKQFVKDDGGDIGIIKKDLGIDEGERCYSVDFGDYSDTVTESELTVIEQ